MRESHRGLLEFNETLPYRYVLFSPLVLKRSIGTRVKKILYEYLQRVLCVPMSSKDHVR